MLDATCIKQRSCITRTHCIIDMHTRIVRACRIMTAQVDYTSAPPHGQKRVRFVGETVIESQSSTVTQVIARKVESKTKLGASDPLLFAFFNLSS